MRPCTTTPDSAIRRPEFQTIEPVKPVPDSEVVGGPDDRSDHNFNGAAAIAYIALYSPIILYLYSIRENAVTVVTTPVTPWSEAKISGDRSNFPHGHQRSPEPVCGHQHYILFILVTAKCPGDRW